MNTALNPELSRLAFEERLIEFCEDNAVPLLERVRLLGIAASRLDTLFMTRVGRLKRLAAIEKQSHGLDPAEQLELVAAASHRIMDQAYGLLEDVLLPALETSGVCIERWADLPAADREFVQHTFGKRLASCVRPLEVSAAAPFPHVRNLRPAVIAVVKGGDIRGAPVVVIELPEPLPRFVPLENPHRLVPIEELIGGTLHVLCPERRFEHVHVFRVTRSASMDLDAEPDDDVLEVVEQEVARRPFQEVVRVEFEHNMPAELRDRLLRDLRREAEMQGSSLDERDMYGVRRLVDLAALDQIAELDLPALKARPIEPRVAEIAGSLLDFVQERDLLVQFPFDDYDTTIQRFLNEARRRDVESLKLTVYRAGKESKVVEALRAARARGVDVTAVVELKASFDERDNIELARSLEADGVRVVLSPAALKVHAKIGLVTLRNGGEVRRLAMIGTGNLNATTARSYIDLWLLTGDDEVGAEIDAVFGVLMGQRPPAEFRRLLVGQYNMRPRFLELIGREAANARAGRVSGIRATMNGLTDEEIIEALCRASQAGVPVDLMVRGVCSLQPGLPGVSENIRVVSVVGRLLQHARIFHFRNGGADEFFMGSADWRPRNMDHRIEVVTSAHRSHHERLRAALDEILSDRGAWVLRSDGTYLRSGTTAPASEATAASARR